MKKTHKITYPAAFQFGPKKELQVPFGLAVDWIFVGRCDLAVDFIPIDESMGPPLRLLKSVGSTTTTVVTVPGKAKDGTAPVAISHDLAVIPPILLIITPIRAVLDGDKSQ